MLQKMRASIRLIQNVFFAAADVVLSIIEKVIKTFIAKK
jgi:hypothetical protein